MSENFINKTIKKCAIILFVLALFVWALFNFQAVHSFVDFIFRVLAPFLVGIFIALLLNVPMSYFENLLKKKFPNKAKDIALPIAIIIIVLVLAFVILLVVPKLIGVGNIIVSDIPKYKECLINLVNDYATNNPDFNVEEVKNLVSTGVDTFVKDLSAQIPNLINTSVAAVISTFTGIINFFIGLGFAFLLLMQRDTVNSGIMRFLYGFGRKEKMDKFVHGVDVFTDSFNKFIVAQCLDALILGVITIIGCAILQIPNCVEIGVLVGFTYIIPIFGVFIGIAISVIIIIFISPIKTLIFLVFVLIAWQLCENFIRPVVVGKKVGMSNLWLFIATILGTNLFGVMGIILGVPAVMTLNVLLNEAVERKEKENVVNDELLDDDIHDIDDYKNLFKE